MAPPGAQDAFVFRVGRKIKVKHFSNRGCEIQWWNRGMRKSLLRLTVIWTAAVSPSRPVGRRKGGAMIHRVQSGRRAMRLLVDPRLRPPADTPSMRNKVSLRRGVPKLEFGNEGFVPKLRQPFRGGIPPALWIGGWRRRSGPKRTFLPESCVSRSYSETALHNVHNSSLRCAFWSIDVVVHAQPPPPCETKFRSAGAFPNWSLGTREPFRWASHLRGGHGCARAPFTLEAIPEIPERPGWLGFHLTRKHDNPSRKSLVGRSCGPSPPASPVRLL